MGKKAIWLSSTPVPKELGGLVVKANPFYFSGSFMKGFETVYSDVEEILEAGKKAGLEVIDIRGKSNSKKSEGKKSNINIEQVIIEYLSDKGVSDELKPEIFAEIEEDKIKVKADGKLYNETKNYLNKLIEKVSEEL
jgi:hypothetical protein